MATPKADYLKWKRDTGAVGCAFARLISARRPEHGQTLVVVQACTSAARIAASAHNQVERLMADPKTHAAAVLFPKVLTLEVMAEAVLALAGQPGWQLAIKALSHPTEGDLVTFGLTKAIPMGPSMLPSEVLMFGDFAVLPPTRRSPVVAMELFVGAPMEYDPKDGVSPSTRANLAHLLTPSLAAEARNNMIVLSGKMRKRSLGVDEDLRAKARVSLVIPATLASALGCMP